MIIGSCALEKFGLNRRKPKDFDMFLTLQSEAEGLTGVDYQIIPEDVYKLIPTEDGYATPDAIYTIKCSHFGWDIKWSKTKSDIIWLESKGCKIIPHLYDKLVEHWKSVNGNKDFLSLNKRKEDFFTDEVTYTYDHDYLHELIAYPQPPVYTLCLKDGEEVLVDKNKFDSLDFEQQVKMFREEIATITAERWLTNPFWRGKISWYEAWFHSLRKTILTLTKNWAQDFLVLNLKHFVKPEYKQFEHLFETLNIEEQIMENQALSLLKQIANDKNISLDRLVYSLACGMDYVSDLIGDINDPERPNWPDSNGRSWQDSSYREEVEAYHVVIKEYTEQFLKKCGIKDYEHIEQEGGGEGGAEYCSGVFRLNGKFFAASWSYYSHHGYDESGCASTLREVRPVEKVVTIWE